MEREARALARINHANIVGIHDVIDHGSTLALVIEFIAGGNLSNRIRAGGLQWREALSIVDGMLAGLEALHGAGLVHRDIKPANIFLADVGRAVAEPMLMDFGISKLLGPSDAALTQNPQFIGTPYYLAPEQADGAAGSPLSTTELGTTMEKPTVVSPL